MNLENDLNKIEIMKPQLSSEMTSEELNNVLLPDGSEESDFLSQDKSWKGLRESRQGKSRIEEFIIEKKDPIHLAFIEYIKFLKNIDPKRLSFFEAGPGNGNDIRYVMKLYQDILNLDPEKNIVGVGYSTKEFEGGFEIHNDDSPIKRQMLFQGNLCDLSNIKAYNQETGKWDINSKINNNTFGIIHMEAVLHALGFGKKTYNEKKQNAQRMFEEFFRICLPGGIIFGRANVFGKSKDGDELSKKEQLEELWKPDTEKNRPSNWRFYPENIKEFDEMMKKAGFEKILLSVKVRKKARERRKYINKVSFLYMKPPINEKFIEIIKS